LAIIDHYRLIKKIENKTDSPSKGLRSPDGTIGRGSRESDQKIEDLARTDPKGISLDRADVVDYRKYQMEEEGEGSRKIWQEEIFFIS
tara:strand:+ start:80 stop:343 length:264 start_codon:yes stop_codon:yes gene_type:complete